MEGVELMGKSTLLLSMPNWLYDRIIELAKTEDVSIAHWMREALKEKAETEKKDFHR